MERDSRYDNHNRRDRDRPFENYRDRYSSHGNYYGMQNSGHEYRNVRGTGNTDYGSGGPVAGYGASSHRGATGSQGSGNHYHYGDPNPYMGNRRNDGGYEQSRGTGWRSERDGGRGGYAGNDRYNRQDNSYRYSGQGRRYEDFARDEDRQETTDDRYRSFNAGATDQYYDRGPIPERREDNDFGRFRSESPYYDGSYDDSNFRYGGEIRQSGRRNADDNYGTGLYASNRAYNSEHQNQAGSNDGEHSSSRYRRHGRSGPDYGADSSIRSYGYDDFGI